MNSFVGSNFTTSVCGPIFRYIMFSALGEVAPMEKRWNYCYQMSDFKTKIHQIQFRLGLCPRPHWASLQRSPRRPDPVAGFKAARWSSG